MLSPSFNTLLKKKVKVKVPSRKLKLSLEIMLPKTVTFEIKDDYYISSWEQIYVKVEMSIEKEVDFLKALS